LANWSVVEFAHVAAKHWVPAGGKEQLSDELSQRPPQMVSVEPAHAARPPTGWPEATRVHVPVLQVWHCPVQSVLQQMPSTDAQWFDVHSTPVVHVFPGPFAFFGMQLPVEAQYWSEGQEADVQAPRHFPLPSVAHAPVVHGEAV
jgi:hypothetical protein